MKKRILSILIIVSIALSMFLGVTTQAEELPTIVVNGVDLIAEENMAVQIGTGTASYDDETTTLTIKDVTISTYEVVELSDFLTYWCGLYVTNLNGRQLNINFEGTNKIDFSMIDHEYKITPDDLFGIYVNGNVKISGEVGEFVCVTDLPSYLDSYAIYASNLELDSASLKIKDFKYGIFSPKSVLLKDIELESNTIKEAVRSNGSVYISGGSVSGESGTLNGIYAKKEINISERAKVNANSILENAILCEGSISIKDSKVTAKGKIGIKFLGSLKIVNSDVCAEGEKEGVLYTSEHKLNYESDKVVENGIRNVIVLDNCFESNFASVKNEGWERTFKIDYETYESYYLWWTYSYFVNESGAKCKKVNIVAGDIESDVSNYKIIIDGQNLMQDSDKSLTCGDGTASYNEVSNTLTLKNVSISKPSYVGDVKDGYGIYINGFPKGINIYVYGENEITISNDSGTNGYYGIFVGGHVPNTNIKGSGSLDISIERSLFGVLAINNLVVTETNLIIEGNKTISTEYETQSAIASVSGAVEVDSADVFVPKFNVAIFSHSDLKINKSDIKLDTGSAWGNIESETGNVLISESNLTVKGSINAVKYVKISNCSNCVIDGIRAENVLIDNSTVKNKEKSCDGIFANSSVSIINSSNVTMDIKGTYGICSGDSDINIRNSIVYAKANYGIQAVNGIWIDNSNVTLIGSYKAAEISKVVENRSGDPYFTLQNSVIINNVVVEPIPMKMINHIWQGGVDFRDSQGAAAKEIQILTKEEADKIPSDGNDNQTPTPTPTIDCGEPGVTPGPTDSDDDEKQVSKIKFAKKSVKVKKRQKFTIKVKLSPDKLSKSAKSVKWSINKKGKKVVKFVKTPKSFVGKLKVKFKALKKGKAKITCKSPNGKKAVCTVYVK